MERRRSLCFTHSDGEDEDHLKRISMCFSIDVSERVKKQNRFHNQVSATERDSRAPGGGLFGSVEDRRPQRSFMSFTVPNKFYADSRDDKYANTRRKSTEREYDESWLREHYEPDRRYQRYQNERYNSRPRIESYNYPMPMKSHRIYNSPRYEAHEERPRRKHYRPRDSYDRQIFREPIPEFVFKKKREKFFEENFDLYNCEFPTKFTHEFQEPTRNSHRRKSGYSARDFENPGIDYYNNQPVRRKSVDFFAHDCEIPYNILKRPKVNTYAENPSCLRFSSVDIPYKRKRRRRSFEYSYDTEPETVERTESGSDICRPKRRCTNENIPRSYKSPAKTRAFNPLTRSSQRIWNQETAVYCTKSRKSLKEKISGFFRRSKCKSRTKCCRYPRGLKGRRSRSRSPSRTCLDNSKSVSSISCAVVQSKRRIKSRPKCIAYPTVYRDKCPSCCPVPDDPEQDEDPKVNCFQFDCATSKCGCSKSCRQCAASSGSRPKARLTVEAPSYGSFATEEPCSLICGSLAQKMPRTVCYAAAKVKCSGNVASSCPAPIAVCPGSWSSCSAENRPLKKPCCSPSVSLENLPGAPTLLRKICSQVCGSQTDIPLENVACSGSRKTVCNSPPPPPPPPPPSCCCSACVNDLLLHQIKQSTINVCLKFCAADGNLLEPAIITASLEPSKPSCSIQSPESISCLSDTRTVCSENNYSNVRSVNQLSSTSCRAQKALKPILSTARKKSSTCCTPYKEKSRETIDWDKCPSQVKISQKSCKKKASSCKCQMEDPSIENHFDGSENCSDSSRLQLQNPCKKSSTKVEFACCPSPPPPPPPPPLECECPKECNDRPSFLEELKRELLDRLRSEQRLDCQLPYQKPTPHISIFPCAQEDACPNPCQSSPSPGNTCWTPL